MSVETELTTSGTSKMNIDTNEKVLSRIQTLSMIAKWCARFGLLVFSVAVFFMAIKIFFDPAGLEEAFDQAKLPTGFIGGLPFVVRAIIFVIAIASMFPGVVGFYVATQLFSSFSKGEVFTSSAAGKISVIGWVLVALPSAGIIGGLLISGILFLFKTAGSVNVTVNFEDGDLMAIVFGLLFVILGRIMVEAAKLSDENRQFI